jgi:hypothetical protein
LQVGIRRMINSDVYIAAYPLHEGPYVSENPKAHMNDRMVSLL